MLDIKIEVVVKHDDFDGNYTQMINIKHPTKSVRSPKFRTDFSAWIDYCNKNYESFECDDEYCDAWKKIDEKYTVTFIIPDFTQTF